MAKNIVTSFAYQSVLPHGEPVGLQVSFLKDLLYVARLKAYRALIEQAGKDIDEEITLAQQN
jgi:hypothetical protein